VILAKVAGTVTASARADGVEGPTFLLVQQCSAAGGAGGECLVALDAMGAGIGEMVLVSQGPSARQSSLSDKKPIDALVCAVVDMVEERGAVVFRK
jgi:microcompartment protein CcmK/EutM